jgi:hypothetical protein
VPARVSASESVVPSRLASRIRSARINPRPQGFGAKTAGGGGNGGYQRFAVELPVADTSPAATAALALEVLKLLPGAPAAWQIVYADPAAAAAAARAGQARAQPLRDACRAEALGGPLLIVSPTIAEVRGGCVAAGGARKHVRTSAGGHPAGGGVSLPKQARRRNPLT